MKGPTQTAEWGAAEEWRSRPVIAWILRGLITLLPLLVSFGLSFWISKAWPPDRIGMNVWLWWVMVASVSVVVMAVTDRVARRFLPLVALLKLSLIFPDEAPSRMRSALRRGTLAQLGREMAHARRTGDLSDQTSHSEYLIYLVKSLGDHDRLTRGHSERVRAYSQVIGEEMGLPDKSLQLLHWAALLHDVGKLDVPAEILNATSLPTDEQWEVLKRHPESARPYLAPLRPWLGEWAHAADEHHLRWDGLGYPTSTAGTDISLAGRIVAVADAFDVMTSHRSYKKAMTPADARTEIAKCAGTQFDPAVTRAFLNVGLGRLRLAVGPLSWFGHTLGLEGVSVGTILGPAATAATATVRTAVAAAAVTTGVVAAGVDAPSPPAAVAFEDSATSSARDSTSRSESPGSAGAPVATAPTVDVTEPAVADDVGGALSPTSSLAATPPTPTSISVLPLDSSTTSSSAAPTTATTAPASTTTSSSSTTTTTTSTTTTSTTTTTTTTTTSTSTTTTTLPPINQPPNVTKPRFQEVPAGSSFSLQIEASDPEGQPLSYTAANLPPGLAIDATGLISGDIPGDQSGIDYHVQVFVSDGEHTPFVKFWIDIL